MSSRTSAGPMRLHALDASFLAFEKPETPMHMGALCVFEGEPFFDASGRFRLDDVRREVEHRLHLVPRLRQRVLERPFGPPVWVDDDTFDIAAHVHLAALPAPGTEVQLWELCDDVQMRLLDHRHPLWDLTFVEGLEGGRVGLIERIHHTMADGVSGVELATVLLDLEPHPQPIPSVAWHPQAPPGPLELAFDGLAELLSAPTRMVRSLASATRHPIRTGRRSWELAEGLLPAVLAPPASRTSLNHRVGARRRIMAVRVRLDTARAIRAALGGTVNDVVLAVVGGGMRALLEARGEDAAHTTVRVLVPVSIRSDDQRLDLGNRTSALVLPLPVGEPDAKERFAAVRRASATHRARHEDRALDVLLTAADRVQRPAVEFARWAIGRQPFVTLVVTNVRGIDQPLYALGARMLDVVPIVPLGPNLDVGIAVISHEGRLIFGLHADPDQCPDLDVLAAALERSFDELGAGLEVAA